MERVAIPFEGKEIIGYLRKPKDVTRPPMVIATGGVDVYKEERNTNDMLGIGAGGIFHGYARRGRMSGVEHAGCRTAVHRHDRLSAHAAGPRRASGWASSAAATAAIGAARWRT